ncbi:hypothetical protein C8R47DRAFT_1202285 [Mycena vitilis]|nr:hypothetical protein C8R47DRAFT_1202285 [Mycena vitilis]
MSSSSYASVFALSVLENPRQTTIKGLVFDAHFYLGGPSQESTMASLRYFNGNDTSFPQVGVYFVYATVAQHDPSSGVDLLLGESEYNPTEYSLVGDIQFLFHLGSPEDIGLDMCQRPYVHLSGVAMNSNAQTATWTVDADQYTSAIREVQKSAKEKGEPVPRSLFPANCIIQNSQRYTHAKKPVPFNKRYFMLAGYLTDISSKLDNSGKVNDRFCVDVENISFLGMLTPGATGGTVADSPAASSSTSSPGGTPGPSKRWSYASVGKGKRRRMSSPGPEDASSGPAGPSSGPSSPSPKV